MAELILPKNYKTCATCRYWSGKRTPNATQSMILFDKIQTGICAGGGLNLIKTRPMESCAKYDAWLE